MAVGGENRLNLLANGWDATLGFGSFNAVEFGGVIAALLLALAILSAAKPLGRLLHVVDVPDNRRKTHERPTPLVGGLAMVVPLLLWTAASMIWPALAQNARIPLAMLLCGTSASAVGFVDDVRPYSARLRLVLLLLISAAALFLSPVLLPAQFHWGHLATTHVSPWLAYLLVPIGMTGFINSVNMADGQNGCVAGMFVIWSSCAILAAGEGTADLAAILLATGLAVLAFNLAGKVFLGGAGAYGVAFIFALLILRLHERWNVSAETIIAWLFVPVADCLRLLIARPLRGVSPLEGDRDHFHHRLEDRFGASTGLAIYLGMVAAGSYTATLAPALAPLCIGFEAVLYGGLIWMTQARSAHARRAV